MTLNQRHHHLSTPVLQLHKLIFLITSCKGLCVFACVPMRGGEGWGEGEGNEITKILTGSCSCLLSYFTEKKNWPSEKLNTCWIILAEAQPEPGPSHNPWNINIFPRGSTYCLLFLSLSLLSWDRLSPTKCRASKKYQRMWWWSCCHPKGICLF